MFDFLFVLSVFWILFSLPTIIRYILLPLTGSWVKRRNGLSTALNKDGTRRWVFLEQWVFTDDIDRDTIIWSIKEMKPGGRYDSKD